MKTFELSKKDSKNGRRHFKVILHEIYPDSCVDEKNGVASEYNENGISWIREYCEKALPTLEGKSIRCEFLDEERTFLNGHGETETKDGLPIFENAVMIGTFEKGYITDIETDEGIKTVCIGEGTIDGLCYHNFCEKLEEDIEDGNAPFGSVEILKTGDNPSIIYKYGYKDYGRIPMVFEYSGYALLGVRPADKTAKILELNQSNNVDKEDFTMGENEIKAIVSQVISEMNSSAEEINAMKEECEKRIAESQELVKELQAEIERQNENIAELESKVTALNEANTALTAEKETLTGEINELKSNLEDAQKKEKIGELNAAIEGFTDEQKSFAQAEIDAFNENPLTSEINSVVDKIHAEIGKKYIEEAKKASEHVEDDVEDIFSEINEKKVSEEDVDIF
jgi:predicted  nucleic acid-binding Zn-ribbon protein